MNPNGEFRFPLVGIFTKHASVDYDVEGNNAVMRANGEFFEKLRLSYQHFVKEKQGSFYASVGFDDFRYNFGVELSTSPPGLTQSSLSFPAGEFNYIPKINNDEYDDDDADENIGFNGRLYKDWKNNYAIAEYQQSQKNLDLTYTYKDKLVTLSPRVSLPSNNIHLNFKRKFGDVHKLSFMYSFNDVAYSGVYKIKPFRDFKIKLGFDSSANLAWSGLWWGEEELGCSKAPGKLKAQFMIQVPVDSPNSPVFLFKVKKRFDFFVKQRT